MIRPTPLVLALAAAVASSLAVAHLHPARAQDHARPATAQQKGPDAEQAQDPEKERRELQQRTEDEVRLLPVVKAASIADVVRFSIVDDDLQLLTTLPPTNGRAKVAIEGFPGILIVQTSDAGGAGGGGAAGDGKPYLPEHFTLIHYDFSKPAEVMSITNIGLTAGHLSIARDADLGPQALSVNLIQSGQYLEETNNEKVRLYITVTDEKTGNNMVNHKLAALNVVDLRRRYPAETTTYLEPIFRDLGASGALFTVNPRAAWQVLAGSYQPSDELSRKLVDLVKQLDADDPKARDAAADELEKLGQPAALVLMRQDRSGWSEEQTGRIDAFLAPYKPLPEDEARRSQTDIEFLLLTLAADDDALRQAALEQLQTVAKKPIEFDLKATGQARHDAVSRLRDQLLGPATRPTTNPAQAATPSIER